MPGVGDQNLEPKGYAKYTNLNAVRALADAPAVGVALPARARYALLKAETQAVRWRDDGSNPSATDGFLIDVGDEFLYTGKLAKIRFFEVAASAVLHVSYYA